MTQPIQHKTPADIEQTSMRIISEELTQRGIFLPEENAAVVRRVIHTTADFDYVENLFLSPGAVRLGAEAMLSGKVIITDTNMALSGISKTALGRLEGSAYCYMADQTVAEEARRTGTTRAVVSMQKAAEEYPDAIFAVGNAPTALYALAELIENGLRPSMIVAVPVGFVNVVEAKEEIRRICLLRDIPIVAAMGRKGGSNVAAAICNALIYTATDMLDPRNRGWH